MRLFEGWGFSTPESDWHDEAQAGLEARIDPESEFEIQKDPWAYEYLSTLDEDALRQYNALLVPIRSRRDAALSRSVQERVHRAVHADSDYWQWDSWGTVPGGAVSATDPSAIASTLAAGLWDLLEKAAQAGLRPRLLHYPRFATDFDYLWDQIGDLIEPRQPKDAAGEIWAGIVDPGKVRVQASKAPEVEARIAELTSMVEVLRQQVQTAKRGAEVSKIERDEAVAQRDAALRELQAVRESLVWRSTAVYRRLRSPNR